MSEKGTKRRDGIVELPNGKFQAVVWAVTPNGKRAKREATFNTRTAAKEWRTTEKSAILRGVSGVGGAKVTLGELAQAWLAHREGIFKAKRPDEGDAEVEGRMSRYRIGMRHLQAILGESFLINDVTAAHGEDYKRLRLKAGVSTRVINRELAIVQYAFAWADKHFTGLRKYRPVEFDYFPESGRQRERTISSAEERALLDHLSAADQNAADFFLLAIDTAMRCKEALNLKWSTVFLNDERFPGGALKVVATKTDRRKVIPISPRVRDMLTRRWAEGADSQFVFRNRSRKRIEDACRLAGKAVGLPYGLKIEGGWIVHDLRRTAINRFLERTDYDYSTVCRVAGVSTQVLLKHYARPSDISMMAAVGISAAVEPATLEAATVSDFIQ